MRNKEEAKNLLKEFNGSYEDAIKMCDHVINSLENIDTRCNESYIGCANDLLYDWRAIKQFLVNEEV